MPGDRSDAPAKSGPPAAVTPVTMSKDEAGLRRLLALYHGHGTDQLRQMSFCLTCAIDFMRDPVEEINKYFLDVEHRTERRMERIIQDADMRGVHDVKGYSDESHKANRRSRNLQGGRAGK